MSVRAPARRVILGVLVLAAAALLVRIAASTGQAGGGWLAPVEVSAPGVVPHGSQVAIDAQGGAVVVWARRSGDDVVVQAATRPAGGSWEAPVDVSPRDGFASDPQLAVDARGNAFVVWEGFVRRRYVVQAAVRPAGGAWRRPAVLSSTSRRMTFPRVAVDARGDAVVAWSHHLAGISTVRVARRPARGGWRRPIVVARDGGKDTAYSHVRLAVGGRGSAVVVWERLKESGGFGPTRVLAVSGTVAGRWEAPVSLSRAGRRTEGADVAMGPGGDAVAVWASSPPTEQVRSVVQSASRPANGRWRARATLSAAGEPASQARVAVDARGNASVIWNRSDLTGASSVRGAARAAGEAWQAPVDVSPRGEVAYGGELAGNARGDVFAIWHRGLAYDEVAERTRTVVRAARGVAGGAWQAPVDLSSVGFQEGVAQVAADPRGGAVAIWELQVGDDLRTQAATLPPA